MHRNKMKIFNRVVIDVSMQEKPTKALQLTLVSLLVLYFLTLFNEFRYINVKLAFKITDRTDIGGWTTQGATDFTTPHYTVPRPPCQCSMNSPGTGLGNPVSRNYVGGPRGGNIWIPPKIHKSGWMY